MNARTVKHLDDIAKPFLAMFREKLKENFANNPKMLAAIEKAEADKTYDFNHISEKPDFNRARKIAHRQIYDLEMSYEGVTELVSEICLIPYADALRICKERWSLSLLK